AALDIRDMFFMIPLREEDKPQFAFTWQGIQYTFNRLPQGYKHSPTIAHNALAALLDTIKVPEGIVIYQYIDDILVGGDNKDQVGSVAKAIWELLTQNGLDIPSAKCQGPGQEIKFLGAWWVAGAVAVPADTLEEIEKGQIPGNKRELQKLLGTLGYWRKHIPGFSVIARPLYDLLKKHRAWDWTAKHSESLKTLKDELKAYQKLGPLHPQDP
ncbi:POL3 protein, partial [Spizella passerina]|nr:POL3 protein [Spizella passerina]